MRRRTPFAAGFVVAYTLVTLLVPSAAGAVDLNPLHAIPSLDPVDMVVSGFKAILQYLIGDHIDSLGKHLINLLLAVPILTDKAAFPKLNEYRGYIQGGAYGILGWSLVISGFRYWLSSYSGSGTYEALTGFIRTGGAVCGLLIFAPAFDQLVRATNALTVALVANPLVKDGLSHGMVGTLSHLPFTGGGIGLLVGIAALIAALILLLVKIVVTALLAILFVASPLAIAIWPIEELAWAMRTVLSTIGALLMFPVLWAICFATFAVLSPDTLFPGSNGDLIDSILSPMITLASLILAFKVPFAALHQAQLAGLAPQMRHGTTIVTNVQNIRGRLGRGGAGGGAKAAGGAASKASRRLDATGRLY